MKTILLVDDENINHILAKRILSGTYQLACVYSGDEAISYTGTQIPDLILMDIVMPGMDGFETYRVLRENEALKDVPVVFLTSKEDADLKERCLQAGAKAYVTKPFRPDALRKLIAEL